MKGVAADISHINTPPIVKAYTGQEEIESALAGSKVVLIPAGIPRKPGMTRDELFDVNSNIIMSLSRFVAKYAKDAFLNVITNPVNTMMPIVAEVMKQENCFNPKFLFGVTQLDVVRASTFASLQAGKNAGDIHVNVVGGHSGKTIVPLFSQTGYNFEDDVLDQLTERVRFGGDEVVAAKQGAGSATLSMAYAAATFANALIDVIVNKTSTVQTAYVYNNTHKDSGVEYFASSVRITSEGISETLPIGEISEREQNDINAALETLKLDIQRGIACANKSTSTPGK